LLYLHLNKPIHWNMELRLFESSEQLSELAASIIIYNMQTTDGLLLCAATGNSPTLTYQKLVEKRKNFETETLRIIKLDEWGGVPMSDPQTCETYLQEKLVKPLQIPEENYISFQSDAEVPADECKRIHEYLEEQGPIDICIVGIGLNGHVALNEPGEALQPHCHVQELSEKSLSHPMVAGMNVKPAYGLTLGMVDILNSKQLILLITGANKAEITKEFMTKKISTSLPASLLWLHPNALCLCDRDAYSLVD
jgi:galactosamine-6-phosphate isomerase